MTGYASSSAGGSTNPETGVVTGTASVELRSVNGRFLDLSLRLPEELRALEPALRELVSGAFKRGKIELRLSTGREGDGAWPRPTTEQLSTLSRLESTVQGWLSKAPPLSVHEVLQWCRGGSGASSSAGLDELAVQAARTAVEALKDAREREGARLVQILNERIDTLRTLAAQAGPLVPAVVQKQQQRFMERWNEALNAAGASGAGNTAGAVSAEAARDRALNEAAAYAIRIDVAEELSRLVSHLDEIERLLKKGGEVGKRLDFLIQELHREANTLGSKSSALELTGISVDMKVAIEQMREQVQNIE